ncbi:MAG: zinc-ribbon domain-containing protein [Hymenobacter sp.]|nr:MAG: zinc-ribbon domain-containing protein [Hymenobacter sp.]
MCWNASAGLCEDCAPDEQEELRAQQSPAAREQIRIHTRAQDYIKDLDFLSRSTLLQCPNCHTKLAADQKFCPRCGTANPAARLPACHCTGCGAALQPAQKFCGECGTKG